MDVEPSLSTPALHQTQCGASVGHLPLASLTLGALRGYTASKFQNAEFRGT